MGSIRAARRAGTKLASSDTATLLWCRIKIDWHPHLRRALVQALTRGGQFESARQYADNSVLCSRSADPLA